MSPFLIGTHGIFVSSQSSKSVTPSQLNKEWQDVMEENKFKNGGPFFAGIKATKSGLIDI
jgi:hypothetical protein